MTKEIKQTKDIQTVIDELAIKGVEALNEMADFTQEQVDHIVHHAAIAALDKHMYLAKLAVDETGRGIYEDKAIKNMYASEYIWNSIKNDKTVGVIAEDKEQGLVSIAEPVGVICGVTPTTNPTSTTIFKALIALKTRNSIVFAFHPSAQKSSAEAARIVRDAAIEAGAPKNCIQWIEEPSIEATGLLMNHPKIATVLATGGPGMVKAAYSTGKPALGVGAGNVPAYIAADAKVKRAVNDIILSKSFDNGMICASEQAAIVDAAIYDEVKAEFEAHQCVIISKKADIAKLEKVVLNEARTAVNGAIVGHSAIEIAEKAGLKVPAGTKLLKSPQNFIQCTFHTQNEAVKAAELITDENVRIFEPTDHFGCCGLYLKCSDAKKCLHPDIIRSKSCYYKKNLESGKIFYGKNANI